MIVGFQLFLVAAHPGYPGLKGCKTVVVAVTSDT